MKNCFLKLMVLRNTRGQDLVEYALMAGFVAVSAGFVMPSIVLPLEIVFVKVLIYLVAAECGGQGIDVSGDSLANLSLTCSAIN